MNVIDRFKESYYLHLILFKEANGKRKATEDFKGNFSDNFTGKD